MRSVTRILPAFIAIVSLVFLANCSKDSQSSLNKSSETFYGENGSASGKIESPDGASFRLLPNSTTVTAIPALCGSVTKNFLNGASSYGSVIVGNDATNYYFSVTGTNGWMLKKVRLYAGDGTTIPVNGGGLPLFNDYPVNESFSSPYPTTWSFSLPIAGLGSNFWVSVRVDYVNGSGTEAGVWSEGDPFKAGNPASKFYCEQQACVVDEGCAFGQGYWYGNGNHAWPDVNGVIDGDITIGNENYTREEARAIWWANNGNCPGIPDAKKAFAFVSSIKLSAANVTGNIDLWDDVKIANDWLASLDRLTDQNICNQPSASAEVKAAVARLGSWMDEHKCD